MDHPVTPTIAPASAPGASCANCGSAALGRFCPECGQERRASVVSLREMLVDFLDDQLSLSSKLPRTVAFLLTRPGFLTREYLNGRMARYIRPLRLYLASSIVFFLLLSVLPDSWLHVNEGSEGGRSDGAVNFGITINPDSAVVFETAESDAAVSAAGSTADAAARGSWVDEIGIKTSSPELTRRLERSREKLRGTSLQEGIRIILGGFVQHISTTVFLLLPVFALLLKLLYARRGRLYVEHFVFALHVHAFAFALFVAVLLLGLHSWTEPLTVLLVLWFFVYLFLAMKRVYGQGVLKTAGKYLLLGASYSVVLVLGMALTLVATLLLL